jgi:hypothetical protein
MSVGQSQMSSISTLIEASSSAAVLLGFFKVHASPRRSRLFDLEIATAAHWDIYYQDITEFRSPLHKGSVVMTDVQNGNRGDSRSGRSRTIACLLTVALFFGSTITSSPAQEDASIMKNITVDCSAFKKEADGTWTTSRQSVLTGPGGSASGPVLSFPGLNLELLRPYGVSMIDLLNTKCGPSRKQSAGKRSLLTKGNFLKQFGQEIISQPRFALVRPRDQSVL